MVHLSSVCSAFALQTGYLIKSGTELLKLKRLLDMNSLVVGCGSRTGTGLAGLSTTRGGISIETRLTAFTPWPIGVMETLLLVRTQNYKEEVRSAEQLNILHLRMTVCARMLGFAK